jgi:VWFA-related protein
MASLSMHCLVGDALRASYDYTAQIPTETDRENRPSRPVTIPISIKLRGQDREPELQLVDLTVAEDGEAQTVASIRAFGASFPITLMVLVQDDVLPPVGNEIRSISNFVRHLPKGSRVSIGYLRAGSLEVRQKFTTDIEKAARSLRIPVGSISSAPYNPYVEVIEAAKGFESQPAGRRALLLVSDGLDVSRGLETASTVDSLDLERAIRESQRRSIAVYSFFAPTLLTSGTSVLTLNAQSSLKKLSDETGGRAFFEGSGPPVSFEPFLSELSSTLERQIALTYTSTHPQRGFHRIEVRSSTPGVELRYPIGYTR